MRQQPVTVREFARLTTSVVTRTLDQATVSPTAFDWLCNLSARMRGNGGAQILQVEDRCWLRLDSYVGVLESPCGLRLEILPKHVEQSDENTVVVARALLRRMLATALNLKPREADDAGIQLFDHHLLEWVMQRFLLNLEHLVKRGMRRDYLRVEEEQPYLRGQLDVAKQMRTPVGRAHLFNIRHDIFSVDRAENRLLKSALLRVAESAEEANNWRLSKMLLHMLDDVPKSHDHAVDFRAWGQSRLMAHYQPIRPWCELVLGDQMPIALSGENKGISLLFPMERLFERYVGNGLRWQLPPGTKLIPQANSQWLCTHRGAGAFLLKPDFLVEGTDSHIVLDAKWKLIFSDGRSNQYGISQSDVYQLLAYGQKYLDGVGTVVLIYPKWQGFQVELLPFELSPTLRLVVVPFDLEKMRCDNLSVPLED